MSLPAFIRCAAPRAFCKRVGLAILLLLSTLLAPSFAADPIKIGFSMGLTGANAPNGKQLLATLQIWREDVNARGGLLGRPVELVYYDDQTLPANEPSIYTKLIEVDKVDLLIGPYGTNQIAAALPVIMQHNLTTVGILGLGANSGYHYPNYFAMIPLGENPKISFSEGFFEVAAAQNPKPKTVAIVGADAEFGKTSTDGARENAKAHGFTIVYDKLYPPPTVDFAPVVRAIKAAEPDIVFVASYPPDTVGFIRAANEAGLEPKLFGGTMIGLLATPFKLQLGPLMNGIVNHEDFVPSPNFKFAGTEELLKKYQAQAAGLGIDPLGYAFPPFGYAAVQVLGQAVEATKSLDHAKLADYMRSHSFNTVVGEVKFGKDGEWVKPRVVFTQWQHVTSNDLAQFKDMSHQVIVWPKEMKTGDMIYPYSAARK
jgi:branched-chain amino acid transport system substrate-binding protein